MCTKKKKTATKIENCIDYYKYKYCFLDILESPGGGAKLPHLR